MSEAVGERRPAVVVPGNHDGVHRGHRALLQAARELAEPRGARVVAMFFEPHPLAVLRPDKAPLRLTMPRRREELLRGAGADDVVVQPFDRAFSELSPEQFVGDVLAGRNGAVGVVVGPDFRFGHQRRGDVELLHELGGEHGMEVRTVEPVEHGGEPVSSSRVRQAVSEGRVEDAAVLLERVHEIEGTVVEGDRRGRTLGYPTANLQTDPVLAPGDGIYAVVARRIDATGAAEAPRWVGAASLGERPTFEGAGRSVEVYLLDFDGDLYGARLRVGFVARVRGEERFDGVDELKRAMAYDVERTRDAVAAADEELLAWI